MYNGSGTWTRLYNWVNDKANGIAITASRMDAEFNDITANGLSKCLTRDGQGIASANLPMGTFRHTGVGNAAARTDYAAAGQIQDSSLVWVAAGGTADALTATYAPAITALVDGMRLGVRAASANATTTPTFSPNGIAAHTITKIGGTALAAGDIVGAGHELILSYNLANTRWELLNPAIVFGTAAGTSAQGNDSRITGALQAANNLSDVIAATARSNLGLGSAAVQNTSAFDASGAATAAQNASLQKTSNLDDLNSVSSALRNLGVSYSFTNSASGSYTLPGGLIIKWGVTGSSGGANVTNSYSFPVAFPNACHSVVGTWERSSADGSGAHLLGVPSTSGFSWQTGNAAAGVFYYIAVGY